jgi:hypothetical protein
MMISQIFMDGFMPRMITADRGGGQDGGAKLFCHKSHVRGAYFV